jgi:hypothetical protein
MMRVNTYEWFKEPGGQNPLYLPLAPYHIQQLHDPLEWARQVGLSRPVGWKTDNLGVFTAFKDLYRKRRRYADDPSWHHWIYLSANEQPLNETWNEDPWDRAFLDLLQYRDKHELLGRSNFHYIACPHSFLCSVWNIDGPALVHFTNEPVKLNATETRSRKPVLDPVSVRVFGLPLNEVVLPGVFPTYFEQMRSITASNSTFWTTRMEYSNFDQVREQALKVLKNIEDKYPQTYGLLAKAADRWPRLLAVDETVLITASQVFSFLAGAVPTYFGFQTWERVKHHWKRRENDTRSDNESEDPVAHQLQGFLDVLSEEDKELWGKTDRGRVILDRVQNGLAENKFDSTEAVIKRMEDVLGRRG